MTSEKKEKTDNNTIDEKIAQASQRMVKFYDTGDMTAVDKNLASPKVQKLVGDSDIGSNLSQRPRQFSENQIGFLGRGRFGSREYNAKNFIAASNTELSTHDLPVYWNKIQKRLNRLESDVLGSNKLKEKLAEFKNTYAQSLADRDDPKFGMIAADLKNRLGLNTVNTKYFGRGETTLGDDGKKVAIYLRELQRAIDEDVDGFNQWNQQLHEIKDMEGRINQLDLEKEEQKKVITRLETEKEEILLKQTAFFSEMNEKARDRSVSPQAVKAKSKNTTAKKSRASKPRAKRSFGSAALALLRKNRTIKQNHNDKVTISSGSSSEEEIDLLGEGGYKRRRKTRRKRKKHKKRKKTRQRKRCTKKRLRKKMICVKGAKKKLKKLRAYTKKIKLNLTRCSKKRMKKWTLKKK
jgi:hypothetical protein